MSALALFVQLVPLAVGAAMSPTLLVLQLAILSGDGPVLARSWALAAGRMCSLVVITVGGTSLLAQLPDFGRGFVASRQAAPILMVGGAVLLAVALREVRRGAQRAATGRSGEERSSGGRHAASHADHAIQQRPTERRRAHGGCRRRTGHHARRSHRGSCAALDVANSVAELVGRVFEREQVAGAAGVATTADGAVVLRLDEPGGDVVVSTDGAIPIDEATYFELKTPVMWEPWVRLEVDEPGLRCEQRFPGGA